MLDTVEYTAPAAWASYLINNDPSALYDDEVEQCDRFVDRVKREHPTADGWPVNCSSEAVFLVYHDARPEIECAADCLRYHFPVHDEEAG